MDLTRLDVVYKHLQLHVDMGFVHQWVWLGGDLSTWYCNVTMYSVMSSVDDYSTALQTNHVQ